MKYINKCKVIKGRFPDSLKSCGQLLDKTVFCFVSLDADLYEPIKHGLQYFYPKLSEGGEILVHDYNNPDYIGSKRAVDEFCYCNKVNKV